MMKDTEHRVNEPVVSLEEEDDRMMRLLRVKQYREMNRLDKEVVESNALRIQGLRDDVDNFGTADPGKSLVELRNEIKRLIRLNGTLRGTIEERTKWIKGVKK